MKNLYLINVLIFSVLFYYKTNAQDVNWERIENLNVFNVNSIAINSNDDIFVTADDSIFRSTDGGNEWISLNTPTPDYTNFRIMFISHNGDIYAGSFNEIYRSTDDGNNWTNISSHFMVNSIYGMVEDTSNNLYVAGCFSGVLRSTNNGSQWIQVLDSADVHGIAILPSQEIIAGCYGRGGQKAFRSADYGESWQEYSWGFTSLICNSTGLLFAVAGSAGTHTLSGSNYVFRSITMGQPGDSVYKCIDGNLIYDIVTDNNNQVFAIGSSGIVSSTDNGNSWNMLDAG